MILIICGPGGVGKGTLISKLLERDHQLWLSRSWTTRQQRAGETESAYTFVDPGTFDERVRAGGFLEHANVAGHLYGTPMPEPPEGRDLLLEIDVQGAQQVIERCEDVCCILVVPPTPAEAEARLRGRGDSEAHISRRMEMAAHEVEVGWKIADHVIVNDDIERAVEELARVVEGFRAAHAR